MKPLLPDYVIESSLGGTGYDFIEDGKGFRPIESRTRVGFHSQGF